MTRTIIAIVAIVLCVIKHKCCAADVTVHCRDPDLGGQIPANMKNQRRFLLIGGAGAGIGNFLVFYPAAYYFAALTGRDILILDDSLIAEMCEILVCGYPKYSQFAAAFPKILNPTTFAGEKIVNALLSTLVTIDCISEPC